MASMTKDVVTSGGSIYQFFPTQSEKLRFKVQASRDVQIALTAGPVERDPICEIFIGTNNAKSSILRNKTKPVKLEVNTPSILSENEFRGFWITWCNGVVLVGKEGNILPFMAWNDPDPYTVKFIGVATGGGTIGKFKIEDTYNNDNVKYEFSPAQKSSLVFKVRAAGNVQVALTKKPRDSIPLYEIFIGISDNKKSAISKNRSETYQVEVYTPLILSKSEFRSFWIRWGNGVVAVGMEGQVSPFMSWTDPEPFSVNYYGISSIAKFSSTWIVEDFAMPTYPNHEPGSEWPTPMVENLPGLSRGYATGDDCGCGGDYMPSGKDWVDAADGEIPWNAVVGGRECDSTVNYVVRVFHDKITIPGKLVPADKCAYIAWKGQVYSKQKYQVLVGNHYRWVQYQGVSQSLQKAVQGGVNGQRQALYVTRTRGLGCVCPGYSFASFRECICVVNGKHEMVKDLDVLINTNA